MVISLAAGCQHKVDGLVRMFLLVKQHKMDGVAITVATNCGVATLLCIEFYSDERQGLVTATLVETGNCSSWIVTGGFASKL